MVNSADKIMLASNSQAMIDTIKALLKDEFRHLDVCVHFNAEVVAQAFRKSQSDVLVLAFEELESAIRVREVISRVWQTSDKPFHAIVLCKKDTAAKAYQLSKQRYFYDYVVFWPLGYDPYRLIMSVHQAMDDLGYNADIQSQRLELETRRQRVKAVSRLVEQLLTDQKARKAELETTLRTALNKLTLPTMIHQNPVKDKPLQVLVVDDDEFQCRLLQKILEEAHYQVFIALSGEDALSQLEQLKPDFILLDVIMPNISGVETLRQLKNNPELADIPVIMISGNKEKEIVLDCIMLGATNYIVKPVNKEVLLSHLPSRFKPV